MASGLDEGNPRLLVVCDMNRLEASQCQLLAIRFQPDLRLAKIDLLCVQRGAFLHGAILPLRTRMLTHLPFPMIFANQMQFQLGKMFSGSLLSRQERP
jgi:hypothetical protein